MLKPVGLIYDTWESQTQEARSRSIRESLEEYILFAREKVPFYRGRLVAYNKNADHPLADVPVLTPAELRDLLPPVSNELIAGNTKGYNVFQSGGTTGRPKTTLFSHEEMEGLTLPNARGFHAVGLAEDDRVANIFATGSLYMTFIHINRMLQEYGCMNFPFSNHTPVDFIHAVVRLFCINVVTGIASVVLSALRGMAERGLEGICIEKVFYGGEHIYEADIREIREKFGTSIIAAPGYGTVDSWYIGYQCRNCLQGVFHAHDDQCYIEIVNEETGTHCAYGEPGMLYVTAFMRRLTPIVRYKVGDLAYWLEKPCSCGRTTPLFRLLGRGDDTLRIGFDLVDYSFIQQAVDKIRGLSGTVQMEKKREAGKDVLIIRVETEMAPDDFPSAEKALEEEIVRNRPTLRKAMAEGSVHPLKIEFLPMGAILRNPRTGKLVRVIDAI